MASDAIGCSGSLIDELWARELFAGCGTCDVCVRDAAVNGSVGNVNINGCVQFKADMCCSNASIDYWDALDGDSVRSWCEHQQPGLGDILADIADVLALIGAIFFFIIGVRKTCQKRIKEWVGPWPWEPRPAPRVIPTAAIDERPTRSSAVTALFG